MSIKIIAILVLGLFLSACAGQRAHFVSEPLGARVLVDGKEVGTTPCSFDYRLSAGKSFEVALLKDGYQEVRYTIAADEWDARERGKWLAAGVVWSPLWLATLFTRKLKDSYEVVMKHEAPLVTAQR